MIKTVSNSICETVEREGTAKQVATANIQNEDKSNMKPDSGT
jgi:hypothetical protein